MKDTYRILVINPGATSTKLSYFENETEVWKTSVSHTAEELAPYDSVASQMPYRKALIERVLKEKGLELSSLDAISGRGGTFRHIPSGTYTVNDNVIHDVLNPIGSEHASNLGAYLARELAAPYGIPAFFTDPVSVDELADVARVTGLEGMERDSYFHALNQKSVARKAAKQLGRAYEDLKLIVVHLGGGVSVAAHDHGRVTDVNNVLDEGAMGMDRGGTLPVNALIDLCYTGISKTEIKKKVHSGAGVYSYLGTKDFIEVERRAFTEGEEKAMLIFRAFAYQLAKDIGTMFAVLRGGCDAIVYTGGMAHSDRLLGEINSYVGTLAPVIRLPGEEEMRALCEGALRVLRGEAEAQDY